MLLYIVLISIIVIIGVHIVGGFSGAIWLPTLRKSRKHLISAIELKDGDIIYDLGCGDGSLLFEAARKNEKIKAVGFEIALWPYLMGIFRKFLGGYKNVNIKFKNLFNQDIRDANIIFVFLLEKCYPRLVNKFKKELSDDCLVIIEAFPMDNIKPYKIIKGGKGAITPFYFYKGYQFKKTETGSL